jgi:hypothetical protein
MTTNAKPPTYNLDAMQFRVLRAAEALTDPAKLEGAFIWSETPQGAEFWLAQAATMTANGRTTLRFMIFASVQLAHLNMQRTAA